MNEWGVFLVITSVFSFLIAIISALKKYVADPIIAIDRTLLQTNEQLKAIKESDRKQNTTLDNHGAKLQDHELRITVMENGRYAKDRI